jgi:quercetin dioxygenase-like cupin family protein
MNNKEYGDLVNAEHYPEDNVVPLDPPFMDERGTIQNLWLAASGSITLITSKKGAVRANHYHQHDWHAVHVISGSLEYYERAIDDVNANPEPKIIRAGEMIFSKPFVVHKMIFPEDCVMITINGIVKNHDNYESSVVRVEF